MLHRPRLGDQEIRDALLRRLERKHAGTATLFLEELGLCRHEVRIDVAVVNGSLHGYEIKSDLDSLGRLERQAQRYGMVLDRMTLVLGERHLRRAPRLVPPWWGVIVARRRLDEPIFSVLRTGRVNPSRSSRAIAELLWRDEALALLEARESAHGVRGKPRSEIWDRLSQTYSLKEISFAVRTRLKERAAGRSPPQPW